MLHHQVAQIAAGSLQKEEVLEKNLDWFKGRFERFVEDESKMAAVMQKNLKPTHMLLKDLRRMGLFKEQPSGPVTRTSRAQQGSRQPRSRKHAGPGRGAASRKAAGQRGKQPRTRKVEQKPRGSKRDAQVPAA